MRLRSVRVLLAMAGIGAATMSACGADSATSGEGGSGVGGAWTPTLTSRSSTASYPLTSLPGSTAKIADRCAADSDCGTGLTCLTDATDDPIFGGGPAGGYCTTTCTADTDCAGLNASCLQSGVGEPGQCVLSCTFGPALQSVGELVSAPLTSKCLGRDDLRCAKTKTGAAVCLPTCGKDTQCSAGRVCDPHRNVCVTQPAQGLAMGSKCDPTGVSSPCAGMCLAFDTGVAMCSSACVLGGGSQYSPNCGGPDAGFCGFAPKGNGAGDSGSCTPACLAHSECQNPAFWCFQVPFLSPASTKGYCYGAAPCDAHGQADCDALGDPKRVCKVTSYGSLCLDDTIPFTRSKDQDGGTIAVPDGGLGDGGVDDAGFGDAGFGDAGLGDAGLGDAGLGDAGLGDAGLCDAGLSDAGPCDAGTDAGDGG